MNIKEARAIYSMVHRTLSVDQTGDTHENIEADFLKAVVPPKTPEERIAEYERILKTIVHDINNALCFVDRSIPPNAPFGLDYRTLKHWIDEALK